jgi:DNA-binding SARP family transcriptional activator
VRALAARATQIAHAHRSPRAAALAAMGRALEAQMRGAPREALAELDEVPAGLLEGDWASQLLKMRGTNLALAGDATSAAAILATAAGVGSSWARAGAYDLLSMAQWSAGEVDGAVDSARTAVELATAAGTTWTAAIARATLACYLALLGDDEASDVLAECRRLPAGGEAAVMAQLGEAIRAAAGGDLDGARSQLAALPPPTPRAVRSMQWRAALECALVDGATERWAEAARTMPALRAAVDAGADAACHLAGGPLVERNRPLLPAVWTVRREHVVVHLLGAARVWLDRREPQVAAWHRPRVRELCLHLALRRDRGREAVAAALWPDLDARAAGANLRVTLTHLLDVVDPDRRRGAGSDLVVDDGAVLTFADSHRLRIDVREVASLAALVARAAAGGEGPAALAAGRRLLDHGWGPLLGGRPLGEWVEQPARTLADEVARAAGVAGQLALEAHELDLAGALGELGVAVDPWAEAPRALVVEARALAGDRDGARRALRALTEMLRGIGVEPALSTLQLAARHRLGPAWLDVPPPT